MARVSCSVCGRIIGTRDIRMCAICHNYMCHNCSQLRRGYCDNCAQEDAPILDGHHPAIEPVKNAHNS